jgi:very-short-patch-repair endonuclease
MHLLAAQAGAMQQEGEAIDLGQTPGDIVFASSADSELALLAAAADRATYDGLRLANLLRLSHNLSVDLWLDKTVRHARLAVIRLLGGPAYWPYGTDELTALAGQGVRVALFPGEPQPDAILRDRSTIPPEDWDKLFALLAAGGAENAEAALAAMRALAEGRAVAAVPTNLPRYGVWTPTRLPPPSPQGGGAINGAAVPHRSLPLEGRDAGKQGGGTRNARHARPQKNIRRARDLRQLATPAERILWRALRQFAPLGYHFRRQVPIGPYFADFACHNPKLVIELDGDTHAGAEAYDRRRDAFLQRAGYEVLRVTNRDAMSNVEGVVVSVQALLDELRARPAPTLPAGIPPLKGGERCGTAVPSIAPPP